MDEALESVMRALAHLGTEQNRKVYRRHGAPEPLHGVSFGDLRQLQRRHRRNQGLAEALWATGHTDARVLATMVADPALVARRTLDAWARDLDWYVAADSLAGLAAATPHAIPLATRWVTSRSEWTARAGWHVLAKLAMDDDARADEFFEAYLDTIEQGIARAKNRTRYAMNDALIAIGSRSPRLRRRATTVARRIGPVEVDHGDTWCKTPDARKYIERIWERRTQRPRGPATRPVTASTRGRPRR